MAIDITNAICIIQQKEAALTCTDDSSEIIKLLNAIKLTNDQVIRSFACLQNLPTATSANEGAIHLVRDTDYLYASDGTQWNRVNDIPTVLTGAGSVSVTGTYPNFTITGASTGINLTDISVCCASASGNGNLAYNNTNGQFTFTPANITSTLSGGTIADISMTGSLKGPSTFTIDPAAHGDNTGTLIVAGNLQVDGTTTTVNSCTVEVDDKNIVLAKGSTNKAAANGGGISLDLGSDGTTGILYDSTTETWDTTIGLCVTGNVNVNGCITAQNIVNSVNGNTGAITIVVPEYKQKKEFYFESVDTAITSNPQQFELINTTLTKIGTGTITLEVNGNISLWDTTGTYNDLLNIRSLAVEPGYDYVIPNDNNNYSVTPTILSWTDTPTQHFLATREEKIKSVLVADLVAASTTGSTMRSSGSFIKRWTIDTSRPANTQYSNIKIVVRPQPIASNYNNIRDTKCSIHAQIVIKEV